jgi:hypothetical protein
MASSDEESAKVDTSTEKQVTFTAAQRIAELNDIDQSLATLLSAAAEAVGILANTGTEGTSSSTPEDQEHRFQEASQTYFATLSSIEVGLKRQVYALEEAGLIQPGEERDTRKGRVVTKRHEEVTDGLFDSSWLNAMADNGVQQRYKRQLLDEAKEFLSDEKAGTGATKDSG